MSLTDEARSWLLEEKKKMAEEGYQEVKASHELLKARLVGLLTLSVTLCAACYGGAVTHGPWSPLCLLMGGGFTVVAGLCVVGLYPTPVKTKNIEPELIDNILEMKPAVVTKDDAQARLARFINAIALDNARALHGDRRCLKYAWITLVSVPALSFLVISLWRACF